MLLHQKPRFFVHAALCRKPLHTFREPLEPLFGSRLSHFSGSMCAFLEGGLSVFSRQGEDEREINKRFRISSANKA